MSISCEDYSLSNAGHDAERNPGHYMDMAEDGKVSGMRYSQELQYQHLRRLRPRRGQR
jgi:cation transport regulator ChaC